MRWDRIECEGGGIIVFLVVVVYTYPLPRATYLNYNLVPFNFCFHILAFYFGILDLVLICELSK